MTPASSPSSSQMGVALISRVASPPPGRSTTIITPRTGPRSFSARMKGMSATLKDSPLGWRALTCESTTDNGDCEREPTTARMGTPMSRLTGGVAKDTVPSSSASRMPTSTWCSTDSITAASRKRTSSVLNTRAKEACAEACASPTSSTMKVATSGSSTPLRRA